ncbi:putative RNA polymerase, sigma 28 subunit, FliA/WhiG subfamily [Xylanimonas cellulosilytica DSM 15894]|uniref:RNA polymerase, sigma 28 subunit, FliA/WhiG subfamily n=1 Tax=Xylanimonas cellulosilytica (strain DSM 15894 / JCM 12276 / CECT 5975 / KCTC 9989 / LMG 20990 / NBRC 107835 / XIL07) TaxID=446471 RepID=D1BYM9_XYLCX|nr:excisionase family DNA-binding protein [Xylanimonas cellulosilytica]ACZ31901.1 putative RNA polymerase, sigma 28 subunit, FliA/WhiG subfamily [Xylanimonas cellulosilytica DSM 15894]
MSTAAADMVDPGSAGPPDVAEVLSFIKAHEARHGTSPSPAFFLSAAQQHDRVELSEQLHDILKEVVEALNRGQSISILTRDQEISTQQAAEILGVSRPTVVRLIEDGELPARVPGAVRRKLRLADVMAYRDELHARRNQFISDTSAKDDGADPDEVSDLLDQARRAR